MANGNDTDTQAPAVKFTSFDRPGTQASTAQTPAAKPAAQQFDIPGIQQWLKENPDDPRADRVRAKLGSMGVYVPSVAPTGAVGKAGDISAAVGQGFFLDMPEKLGQAAEKLPGLPGRLARQAGGAISSIPMQSTRGTIESRPPGLQPPGGVRTLGEFLQRGQEAGERNPIARFGGNIGAAALVPGAGESVLGNLLIGGAVGGLQPLNPNDPNYARDLAAQIGTGMIGGGVFGPMAGRAATQAAAQKSSLAAQQMASQIGRFIGDTPERATQRVYQRIYNQMGEHANAPTATDRFTGAPGNIGINTAADVQNYVGGKLNALYKKVSFTPNASWLGEINTIRSNVAGGMANPEMVAAWNKSFANDAFNPALYAEGGGPVTGEKLNQLTSDLSARANDFGKRAQSDAVHADQWYDMANGLREIRESIIEQIAATNPKFASELRSTNIAYHLSDVMVDATKNAKGGIADPASISRAWRAKVGTKAYGGDTRFRRIKNYLDAERQTLEGRPGDPPGRPRVQVQPPPTRDTTPGSLRDVVKDVGRGGAHLAAFEAARLMGLPWWQAAPVTLPVVSALTKGGLTGRAAEIAGMRPGIPAAIGGQIAPSTASTLSGFVPDVSGLWTEQQTP